MQPLTPHTPQRHNGYIYAVAHAHDFDCRQQLQDGRTLVDIDAEFEVAVLVTGLVFFDEGEGEAGAGGVGFGEGVGGDWGGAGGRLAVASGHVGAGFLLRVARGEFFRGGDGGRRDGA